MAMTLRKDAELEQVLRDLAEQEGVSQQEVIRRAVLERASRRMHRHRVNGLATELSERWRVVLDRLGDS